MALRTRTVASVYNGAASITLQYDDATANLWLTSVLVTVDAVGRQWFGSMVDTITGHSISRAFAAGTVAVPANQLSLTRVAGYAGVGDGVASGLQLGLRYPA